ncbi:MAG: hypothetical protein GY745_04105 [Actinomycetia bacterium]|nr:hypothetical protein [Actinomycetes bacterium]MCP4084224.1 hypothetical protein [Actinomycetes bacterium]
MQNALLSRTAETSRTVQAWASRLVDQVPVLSELPDLPDLAEATAEQREKVEALAQRLRSETEQLINEFQGRLPATRAEVADLEARLVKAEKAVKKPAAKKASTAARKASTPAKKASTA